MSSTSVLPIFDNERPQATCLWLSGKGRQQQIFQKPSNNLSLQLVRSNNQNYPMKITKRIVVRTEFWLDLVGFSCPGIYLILQVKSNMSNLFLGNKDKILSSSSINQFCWFFYFPGNSNNFALSYLIFPAQIISFLKTHILNNLHRNGTSKWLTFLSYLLVPRDNILQVGPTFSFNLIEIVVSLYSVVLST